jgi:hypothetical protein
MGNPFSLRELILNLLVMMPNVGTIIIIDVETFTEFLPYRY